MYEELIELMRRAGTMGSIGATLNWNRQVTMPPKALPLMAKQLDLAASLRHEFATDPKIGMLLELIDRSVLTEDQRANVHEIEIAYNRVVRVPQSLIKEMTQICVMGEQSWKIAREENDYGIFSPHFRRLIEVQREIALTVEPDQAPYQTMLDGYERGISVDQMSAYMNEITAAVVPLIAAIRECPVPDTSILSASVPDAVQMTCARETARAIGYDLERGRLDIAIHPFCGAGGLITTRLTDGWFKTISSTTHEAGHGLYEHNLPEEHFGTPLGMARSAGMHESQAMIFENHVGKSLSFLTGRFPYLQRTLAPTLDAIDAPRLYRLVNAVKPDHVRVRSDELTYPLHITIRFDLERDLISGKLDVKDLPDAWNTLTHERLGIVAPTLKLGCLQDIHWAGGGFGYFPVYNFGRMISAQLWKAIEHAIPDIDEKLLRCDLIDLHAWLKDNVHKHGCRYSTTELITRATGEVPHVTPLAQHLKKKFGSLYGIS